PGREAQQSPLDRGHVVVRGAEVGQQGDWPRGPVRDSGDRYNHAVLASPPDAVPGCSRRLLLFTKPARAGRVKTRLIGDLTPAQAADLHAAFVEDLLARLTRARCDLHLAWALEQIGRA